MSQTRYPTDTDYYNQAPTKVKRIIDAAGYIAAAQTPEERERAIADSNEAFWNLPK